MRVKLFIPFMHKSRQRSMNMTRLTKDDDSSPIRSLLSIISNPLKHIHNDIDLVIFTFPQILTTEQTLSRSLVCLSVRDLDVCNIAFELAWIDLLLKPERNKMKPRRSVKLLLLLLKCKRVKKG